MPSGGRLEGLNSNWWGWEKGKRIWQSTKAGIEMQKVRWHWLHPCCLVTFRIHTLYFISWIIFLKQASVLLLYVFTPWYTKFLKQMWLHFEITRKQETVVLTEIFLGVFLYSNHNHLYWQVQKTRSFSCNETDYQKGSKTLQGSTAVETQSSGWYGNHCTSCITVKIITLTVHLSETY